VPHKSTSAKRETPSWWKRKSILAAGLVVLAVLAGWAGRSLTQSSAIGSAAYAQTKALVAFGPRPVGSEAHKKMEAYILGQLQAAGAAIEQDRFTTDTPVGAKSMTNIIGRLGKPGARIIVLATHYDTKLIPGFVGANDGGSSTGLVLALAPILAKRSFSHEIRLVFLDGEEAFKDWTDTDSVYGSKHLAAKWKADGTASRIGAFILVDMIGDASLDLFKDTNSTPWLRDEVWNVAQRLGYADYFLNRETSYEDDHIPFVKAGVPSVDLLDLDYPPWHTTQDTMDKLSPRSMQIVGEVVLESIAELDRQR
jgi:Zn-dependent M28 family amino/carboxypeptidase